MKAKAEKTKVTFIRLPMSKYRELSVMAAKENRAEGNMASVLTLEAMEARGLRKAKKF